MCKAAIDYTHRVSLRKSGVYYTADVIIPDGSDTGVYGDGCEPGTGAYMESGWIDPRWSRETVHENRDHVRPDMFEASQDGDRRRWLADRLSERVNCLDIDNYGNHYSVLYGEAEEPDYRTGITVSVAAHPYGFEDWEIESALDMIRRERLHRARIAREYLDRLYPRAA